MSDNEPRINNKLIQVLVILFFLFIVSLISSFNSYGSWTEIPQINSDGQTALLTLTDLKKKRWLCLLVDDDI